MPLIDPSTIGVTAIGFGAQLLFSARVLVQWFKSEKAHKVLSPTLFWVFSVAGSWMLCLYGWLRGDFAIVLGQVVAYYVYLWNLKAKGVFAGMHPFLRWLLLLTPPAVLAVGMRDAGAVIDQFFGQADLPWTLILFGTVGQMTFTLRFVYQWYYSFRRGLSVLPAGFWYLSMLGSVLVFVYGCLRADIVLILGQVFGMVAYTRNIIIGHRARQLARERSYD